MSTSTNANDANGPPPGVDPVFSSSRTARQIYVLGQVEKDISRLLSLASTSMSLLSLPQTDGPDDHLPQGEERSELFVAQVGEFFDRLDNVHLNIRSTLAHIRQARMAPSAISAPRPGAVPPNLGSGLASASQHPKSDRGFQEQKIETDAWKRVADALERIKAGLDRDGGRETGEDAPQSPNQAHDDIQVD